MDTHITPPPASVEPNTELHPHAVTTHVKPPTPTVPNNPMAQNYVSDHITHDENCQILLEEISGNVLGPMLATKFLDKFLLKSTGLGVAPAFNHTSLKSMMGAATEVAMYKPFVSYAI